MLGCHFSHGSQNLTIGTTRSLMALTHQVYGTGKFIGMDNLLIGTVAVKLRAVQLAPYV
jgi:hypothetical protein